MGRIKYLFAGIAVLCSLLASAQELLTVDDAINIALENNYNIRIARFNSEIAEVENTLGNAGLLPTIDGSVNKSFDVNDTRQEFFSGEVRQGEGVENNALLGNIILDWTLFDGMRAVTNKQRLEAFEVQGQLLAQAEIEFTLAAVIATYYEAVQYAKQIESIETAIQLSAERKQLAADRERLGSGSGLEVLLATVDINADSSALVRQQFALLNTKALLNELMGRAPDVPYNITDRIDYRTDLNYEELSQKIDLQSRELLLARNDLAIAEADKRTARANYSPAIGVQGSYNYLRAENEIGVLKSNQVSGFTYGFGARWSLFDGFNKQRQSRVASIAVESRTESLEQTRLRLKTELYQLYTAFTMSTQLITIERKNLLVAQENLDIARERMRIGSITALELREAQRNLVDAEFRLFQVEYEAKVTETQLLRLSGDLLR
jgi:outer membrane protein TolC